MFGIGGKSSQGQLKQVYIPMLLDDRRALQTIPPLLSIEHIE